MKDRPSTTLLSEEVLTATHKPSGYPLAAVLRDYIHVVDVPYRAPSDRDWETKLPRFKRDV